MIKVTPKGKEPLPSLIKRFRKLCEKEGIMRDIRRCEAYEKPSEERRRRQAKNRKPKRELPPGRRNTEDRANSRQV